MLARVSIVNSNGKIIYDKFVKPTQKVTNYRTSISGIRPQDIEHGENFLEVKQEVSQLLKNKVLIGHGLEHDLTVLQLSHPQHMIRDTSTYWKFKKLTEGRKPSLKLLALHFLGINIQEGEHSSVEDAKAVLQLYMFVCNDWEKQFKQKSKKKRTNAIGTVLQHTQSRQTAREYVRDIRIEYCSPALAWWGRAVLSKGQQPKKRDWRGRGA